MKERKMQKKLVLLLLMATLLAGGVFAQINISAGFGGTFSADFTRHNLTKDGKDLNLPSEALSTFKFYFDQNITGGGFYAYFDASYAMLSLGMSFYDISPADSDLNKAQKDAKITSSLTTFDIGLYGKFPISLGAATLFPMLGVDAKIAVAQDTITDGTKISWGVDYRKDDSLAEYWSTVWFKFGVGGDIPLGDKLYLRPMFLYGIGTVPKSLQETLDTFNDLADKKLADIIVHGLDIKLAVGFKF
jgi:hypothetical protein